MTTNKGWLFLLTVTSLAIGIWLGHGWGYARGITRARRDARTESETEASALRAELATLKASLDNHDKIVHGIDGDTVELRSLGRVRIIGVDTPETWHKVGNKWEQIEDPDPRGVAAAEWMHAQEGRSVRVQFEKQRTDRYGRTLAHLYLLPDGPDVACELLRRGWADIMAIPPNTARLQEWKSARIASRHPVRSSPDAHK